jgi:hypothetical protein
MNGCFQETKVVDLKYFVEKRGFRDTYHDVKTLGEADILEKKSVQGSWPKI